MPYQRITDEISKLLPFQPWMKEKGARTSVNSMIMEHLACHFRHSAFLIQLRHSHMEMSEKKSAGHDIMAIQGRIWIHPDYWVDKFREGFPGAPPRCYPTQFFETASVNIAFVTGSNKKRLSNAHAGMVLIFKSAQCFCKITWNLETLSFDLLENLLFSWIMHMQLYRD